jgi:hypothetical protein
MRRPLERGARGRPALARARKKHFFSSDSRDVK